MSDTGWGLRGGGVRETLRIVELGPRTATTLIIAALVAVAVVVRRALQWIGDRRSARKKKSGKWIAYGIVGLLLAGGLGAWIMDRRGESVLLSWLLAVNVVAFVIYGWDKLTVNLVVSRVPEKTLYLLALVGGSVGALVAQHVFRHKISKTSFQLRFGGIVVVQAAVLMLYFRSGSTPT